MRRSIDLMAITPRPAAGIATAVRSLPARPPNSTPLVVAHWIVAPPLTPAAQLLPNQLAC
jgi:hypothetical protein